MEKLGADAFQHQLLRRDGTWVVAFLADWCPFCHRFLPMLSEIEGTEGLRVAVGDVTSEQSPLWDDFRIEVVPTVVVFRDGRPVFRADGILGAGLARTDLEKARSAALTTKA